MFVNTFGKFIFPRAPANQGKPTNQLRTTGSCVKIVGDIGKSFCEHGREQKFRRTLYPLCREHPLCLSKNQSEIVRNELFANAVLITRILCLRTSLRMKCLQGYTQLYAMNTMSAVTSPLSDSEVRGIIWYLHLLDTPTCEIHHRLCAMYGANNVHKLRNVYYWVNPSNMEFVDC